MTALDVEIARVRKTIHRAEIEGNVELAKVEGARLSGMLTAYTLNGGTDQECLHPVHEPAGMKNGRTQWRCVSCGTVRAAL